MMVAFGVLEAAGENTSSVISPGLAIGSAVGLNIIMFVSIKTKNKIINYFSIM